jgi:hypothetical protein
MRLNQAWKWLATKGCCLVTPRRLRWVVALLPLLWVAEGLAANPDAQAGAEFPRELSSYPARPEASLLEVIASRIRAEPFNLIGTVIFLLAIVHTFMAPRFMGLSHRFAQRHREKTARSGGGKRGNTRESVSFRAEIFHFLGEIEAVFGIWVIPLLIALSLSKGWLTARDYLGSGLQFTEPVFVVVIMSMAASRPILKVSEQLMGVAAAWGRGSIRAWWFSILTIGPLLGSFVTEPAAMTISALLLAERFFRHRPAPTLAYGTLGLLFVNVSIGGTLTHFAAPPVLMVAGKWGWGFQYMLFHFGWKAAVAILVTNVLFLLAFRRQFGTLQLSVEPSSMDSAKQGPDRPVPAWITCVHILFLAWTVLNNHYPALFVGGFLFYLAFTQATEHEQGELNLRPALLVGFFLAGLVVHGGLQGWWIEPVLTRLTTLPLFFGAMGLTAFNDNAAITYLASLVPGFSAELKYAVVAGAVVGGGLTVIANAPNPAGLSILSKFFPEGVSPLRLFLGALGPTLVTATVFLLLH